MKFKVEHAFNLLTCIRCSDEHNHPCELRFAAISTDRPFQNYRSEFIRCNRRSELRNSFLSLHDLLSTCSPGELISVAITRIIVESYSQGFSARDKQRKKIGLSFDIKRLASSCVFSFSFPGNISRKFLRNIKMIFQ